MARKPFEPNFRNALANNGWSVPTLYATVATRAYRGGIVATIYSDGAYHITVDGKTRCKGTEAGPILAAMECNNRAWDSPEYRAARHEAG